ncbi:hypothetical protein WJX84_009854 [Apatococcus fuscideae]|uniref:Clathrin light chain n=1 Tax=Apatococcus fuscideae TaxID=2026836 RepID=A0AAW1SXM9_9CHLO
MATSGDIEIGNLQGENISKAPGTINGETVSLKHLTDCTVYLLDYSSEVEVTNCTSCQIFIGPIDGPAIFDACVACNITVACQQFQAKNCRDVDFGLYCSTQPTLKDSNEIRVACWMGAYPGLTQHFFTCNLDPTRNQWNKMNDLSSEMGLLTNFELVDQPEYWEVPLEGAGPPDNPVPNAEGQSYQAGGYAGQQAAPPTQAAPVAEADESFFSTGPTANGNAAELSNGMGDMSGMGQFGGGGVAETGVNPKVAAMQKEMRERLARQEEIEQTTKSEMNSKAKTYLSSFYEKRQKATTKKHETNRQNEANPLTQGPQGTSGWEKTVNMIDFGFNRPNGADLARYKSILFTAKAKNMPIGSAPGASVASPLA